MLAENCQPMAVTSTTAMTIGANSTTPAKARRLLSTTPKFSITPNFFLKVFMTHLLISNRAYRSILIGRSIATRISEVITHRMRSRGFYNLTHYRRRIRPGRQCEFELQRTAIFPPLPHELHWQSQRAPLLFHAGSAAALGPQRRARGDHLAFQHPRRSAARWLAHSPQGAGGMDVAPREPVVDQRIDIVGDEETAAAREVERLAGQGPVPTVLSHAPRQHRV